MLRTMHPPRRVERRSWTAGLGLSVASAACGAVAGHLLDPDRGHARRARLRGQAAGAGRRNARRIRRRLVRTGRLLTGRFQGVRHRLSNHQDDTRPDDITLTQKIRSEVLGKATFDGCSVNIDSCDGVVHLRGELPSAELMATLEHAVERVHGVRKVESFLHLPGQPAPNK